LNVLLFASLAFERQTRELLSHISATLERRREESARKTVLQLKLDPG